MDQNRIREYYDKGIEKNRLNLEYFKLEGIRTREIITRYLDRPGLRIADIGGGAGFYADQGRDIREWLDIRGTLKISSDLLKGMKI